MLSREAADGESVGNPDAIHHGQDAVAADPADVEPGQPKALGVVPHVDARLVADHVLDGAGKAVLHGLGVDHRGGARHVEDPALGAAGRHQDAFQAKTPRRIRGHSGPHQLTQPAC